MGLNALQIGVAVPCRNAYAATARVPAELRDARSCRYSNRGIYVKFKKLAGFVPLTVIAAFFLAPSAASADPTTTLYVDGAAGANCSDGGSGTQSQPFCTISAATSVVTAGQTVLVTPMAYPEHVNVTTSGTPSAPITFTTSGTGSVTLSGPGAGITVDGVHDVAIDNFHVVPTTDVTNVLLENSSALSLSGDYATEQAPDQAAFILAGVTGSTFTNDQGQSFEGTAWSIDAASIGNTFVGTRAEYSYTGFDLAGTNNTIQGLTASYDGIVGVRVSGRDNTFTGATVSQNTAAGIQVFAGASGTTITDSTLTRDRQNAITISGATGTTVSDSTFTYTGGYGIAVDGGGTTAIANNTLMQGCGAIDVDGTPTGVSIENNISNMDGQNTQNSPCASGTTRGGLEVAASAEAGTTMDYNTVYNNQATPYVWGGTPYATLIAFQAASGQGAHDSTSYSYIDSANSAAPGYPATDITGHVRQDSPIYANTGAGPVTYADRGAIESVSVPQVLFAVTQNVAGNTVTVDASGTLFWTPKVSYTFDFGDGTPAVTQASAVLAHTYAAPGMFWITVSATDTLNGTGTLQEVYYYGRGWNPCQPFRIMGNTTIGAGKTLTLNLANTPFLVPAIPSMNAISLNVGTTAATAATGALTVYPDGASRPATPSVHFVKGSATVQNLVTVQVRDGKVDFYNGSTGTVQVSADVEGFYDNSDVTYEPIKPKRVVSTTTGIGVKVAKVKAGATLAVPWTTLLPGTLSDDGSVGAALNVEVANETASTGSLTAYDPDQGTVETSDLHWNAAHTVSATVTLSKFGTTANFVNHSTGTIDVMIDLQGEYTQDPTPFALYLPLTSSRVLDKTTAANTPVTTTLTQVPGTALKAVMLDITVTNAKAAGYLSVTPAGTTASGTTQMHWLKGQTLTQMVIVPLSSTRKISISNSSSGSTEIQVDLYGYFVGVTGFWEQ
jgi:hypothetical protein